MAITSYSTTYSELKASVSDWMARSDVSGVAAEFIALGEARLNRKIEMDSIDATLVGVAGSRRIDVSSLKVVEPNALHIVINGEERKLTPKPDGNFEYSDELDEPNFYGMEGQNIDFDVLCASAYEFRFTYRGRFALSDSAPTNDLLTNHPDVYLAASLIWGGVYLKDGQAAMGFKTLLDEFIEETTQENSQRKRGTISPPSELASLTGSRTYDGGFN